MAGRWGSGVGVGVLLLVVGCGGGDDDGAPEPAPEPTTSTASEPATSASTTAPAAPAAGAVPDVVGLDLQLAQDTMQAEGFYVLVSHDATGQGRLQVIDRNWTVCDQDPAAGTPADATTTVDLGAVKDEEACPG